jgi:hypothetical protein
LTGLRPRRERSYGLWPFLVTVSFATLFFFSLRPATDPDYGWHIANGRHVFDGVTFSGADPYSWTARNLWIAHEWLTEAAMSAIHDLLGATGNSLLAAIIITAAYALVYAGLRARSFGQPVALASLLVCFAGALRSLSVRPHVIEMLFLALSVWIVESYLRKRSSRRRFILCVAGLGLLWVNMHGSFPLLAAVLAITAVELVIARDTRWPSVAVAAVVAISVNLLNPWSYRIFGFAVQSITSGQTLASIDEWKRPVLTEWIAAPLLFQLVLGAVGVVLTVRVLRDRTAKAFPATIGLLRVPAFAFLALQSGRHVMLFGIANAAFIAIALSWAGRALRAHSKSAPRPADNDSGREIVNVVAAAAVIVAVLFSGWRAISPEAQSKALEKQYPVRMIDELNRSSGTGDRLLNDYNWGGFIIMRSPVKVFIDGRSELYGDSQLERYASIIHLQRGWDRRLNELGVTRVLMPSSSPLARALNGRQWTTLARDSVGWLLGRPR